MGIFNIFKKKELTFTPNRDVFFDILDDNNRIRVTSSTHGNVLNAYYNTPQIASIINYSGKVFSRNDLRFYNNSGEETENNILDVFDNPHPLYSQGEFWETFSKQYDLFNIVLTYKVVGISELQGLFILPFHLIDIVPVDNLKPIDILLAQDIKDIISHYQLNYDGKKYKIPAEDVWMLSGTSLKFDKNGFLEPDNIIETLNYPIKNIQANYEARYNLVENRGQLGVWVNNQSDSGSYVPIEEKEKKNVRDSIRQTFGLTKGRNIVGFTNANLKFESASLPIKDMELSQGIKDDKITLCDAFSFPILLLNEVEGSTFANMDTAERLLYTNKTIPFWELVGKSITREFLTDGYVEFYTNDIEVLKKDDKVQAETNQINTQIIREINDNNTMDYNTKVNTLILIADISEDIAKEVITDKPINNETI